MILLVEVLTLKTFPKDPSPILVFNSNRDVISVDENKFF